MNKTLVLIKPNVFEDKNVGAVISAFEEKGVTITRMKMFHFTRERAEGFYDVHQGKPYFEKHIAFMISGPIIALEVEYEDCVAYIREIIGATDPAKATPGTIRHRFASSLPQNAVHASDSPENASHELDYIFTGE